VSWLQARIAESAPPAFVLAQYTDSEGRATISDADVDAVRRDFVAALRRRWTGLGRELRTLAEPWNFALDSVTVPVRLWHGTGDTNVPVEAARALAATLPDCEASVDDTDHLTTLLRNRESVVARYAAPVDWLRPKRQRQLVRPALKTV
jgi:pimeloyl-ACP methyl ester carboxylesterase